MMNSHEMTADIRSYAKVNLTLDILERRPDGYHDIESIMQTISLHDEITLHCGGEPGIRISCDIEGIPTDERNLAWTAAFLLLTARSIEPRLDIRLRKRIPSQAGLGGGSSNAAAVLRGLNALLGLRVPDDELRGLAAKIGSDVPFFLTGGTAFVAGRGECVASLSDLPRWWFIIVKPPFGVSTAWAYNRLDEIRGQEGSRIRPSETFSSRLLACIGRGNCKNLSELLGNDLERPAIEQHPEIAAIKADLEQAGAKSTLLCGSGSAVFGLFRTEAEAQTAAERVEHRGRVFVACPVRMD